MQYEMCTWDRAGSAEMRALASSADPACLLFGPPVFHFLLNSEQPIFPHTYISKVKFYSFFKIKE